MHNVLLILLHRPFVSDGDLHSSPSNAINSFLICATAAKTIVKILRAYDAAFSIQRAPYLISYATYVSATIHVRIAAQRDPGSEAHVCLATCLSVFRKNQETNWAVRRANLIIENLMKRMHVSISDINVIQVGHRQEPQLQQAETNDDRLPPPVLPDASQNHAGSKISPHSNNSTNIDQNCAMVTSPFDAGVPDYAASDLNIDAIIQSFIREQQSDRPLSQIAREDPADYIPTTTNQYFHPTSYVQDSIPTNDPHTQNLINSLGDAHGVNLTQDRLAAQFSADDMLFGFNSSAMEGIGWEFDDRMF